MRPRALSLACLSVILAACAANPQTVVDQGRRHEFASGASPRSVARCTALNARSFSSAYTADWYEMVKPGSFQAVVTQTGGWVPYTQFAPYIVVRTWPAEKGSQLEMFMPSGMDPQSESDWIERLRRGC
jgi:hypothetical protein